MENMKTKIPDHHKQIIEARLSPVRERALAIVRETESITSGARSYYPDGEPTPHTIWVAGREFDARSLSDAGRKRLRELGEESAGLLPDGVSWNRETFGLVNLTINTKQNKEY